MMGGVARPGGARFPDLRRGRRRFGRCSVHRSCESRRGRRPGPEADLTRALYEQYANQIFRYCLHQLGSREEAEDAVQSTFLNAFRGIKRGVVPELESAWLFKIAHNVCLSRRRSSVAPRPHRVAGRLRGGRGADARRRRAGPTS